MGEHLHHARLGQFGDEPEILVGPADTPAGELVGHVRVVDRPGSDPVHRTDEVVERVPQKDLHDLVDVGGEEVDFEPEKDRQAAVAGPCTASTYRSRCRLRSW